jgi:predicted metal-dependent hydrolase
LVLNVVIVKFPVKCTKAIFRIRLKDNTEWIKTRQEWWGLDEADNLVNQSMIDKETYDAITPKYKLKKENERERDSKMIREVFDIEHKIKYTEPLKPETVQKLFDMRDGDCALIIKDETGIGEKPPYSIPTLHQFMNTPFQELFE